MKAKTKRIYRILINEFALLSAEYLIVIALGIISFMFLLKLSSFLLTTESIVLFDEQITSSVQALSSSVMDKIMFGFTFIGNRQFIIWPLLFILIYFLFIKPHRWYSIKIPVVAIGSITINIVLKELFARERPLLEHMVAASGLSFPSGHAMFSMSFIGLLIYIYWTYTRTYWFKYLVVLLLTFLILGIGTSRIYLGVHYPSDVLAGFLAGFIWLVISILTIRLIEMRIKKTGEL